MSSLRVGIAQVIQTTSIAENLAKAVEFIDKASERGVALLCFPEAHLPGYRVGVLDPAAPSDEAHLSEALDVIAERCRERAICVCVGTETPRLNAYPFNSAVVIDARGNEVVRHHKSRLTPRDEEGYAAGSGPTLFELDGIPIGIVICFEGFRFPEATRELATKGAKIVLHPQFNHVFPGAEWKLPVHEALIVARAAENTLFFVSANMAHPRNNCRSLVVAPNGLIEASSELGREMLVVSDLDLDLATHAFLRGDPLERRRVLAEA
jgi:predicted amidohydrolase